MTLKKAIKGLMVVVLGGTALVTSATCDPYSGAFDFFRDDDDNVFFDGYYYDDFYIYEPPLICDEFGCY